MNEAIDEAVKKADEIEKKVQDFFGTVNDVLDWVPWPLEHLIDPIVAGMEKIGQKISEFWAEVKDYFDNTGNPDKLQKHSEAWIEKVGNPLGETAGSIAEEKLSTNTEWSGSGAEAYKPVARAQGAALNSLKLLSTDVGNNLKTLANAIENFWIALGFALADLAVTIIAAIVEAASVVAIPAVIPTVLVGIGIALTAITFAVKELKTIYDTIDTSQDRIEQGLTRLGEEWAKATPVNQQKIDDTGQWEPITED